MGSIHVWIEPEGVGSLKLVAALKAMAVGPGRGEGCLHFEVGFKLQVAVRVGGEHPHLELEGVDPHLKLAIGVEP